MKRMGKILWTVIVVMCAFSACAAAPYSIQLPEGNALIDESGAFIAEPGMYGRIVTIEPGAVYLAGETGNYRMIDAQGQPISLQQISMARCTDDVILFRWNGMYGAMDLEGEIIVGPRWTQLVSNGEGGFLALEDSPFDNVEDEIIYIDPEGIATPVGHYTVGTLPDVLDDRMPYMTSDGSFGFVDGRGQQVTEPNWLYAGGFSDGAAIVSDINGMGLVDKAGSNILECGYAFIGRSRRLTAAVSGDGLLEVYTADGRERLFEMEAHGYAVSVVGGCIALTGSEDTLLYDRNGRCIYRGSAKASFAEGLNKQIIVSDGEWGDKCVWLMGPDGAEVSGKYQQILPLSGNRYAFIEMRGGTYFSDVLDGFQRSWDYDSIRYGMMDGEGREILPADSLEIISVDDDRFILVKEDGTHLCDEQGGIVRSWLLPEEDASNFG